MCSLTRDDGLLLRFRPGSSEPDEIYKITSVLGTPTAQTWAEGLRLAAAMNFRFAQFAPTPLSALIPHASPEACQLMTDLMRWDPAKRPTAMQVLQHPFFLVGVPIDPPIRSKDARPALSCQQGSGCVLRKRTSPIISRLTGAKE